jgi:hypothetical protein
MSAIDRKYLLALSLTAGFDPSLGHGLPILLCCTTALVRSAQVHISVIRLNINYVVGNSGTP